MRYIFLHQPDYAEKQKPRKTAAEKAKAFIQSLFFTMSGMLSIGDEIHIGYSCANSHSGFHDLYRNV